MINNEDIAHVAHEVNRAFCRAIGDNSQKSWEEAPEWQVKSAINGVKFHVENPDAQPEDSHKSWLAEKERDGWVYGEVKDEVKKTHPCCVPYDQLPENQKAKDYIYSAVVKTLLDIEADSY